MTTLICHFQCCHNITTLGCLPTHTYKPRPGNWVPKGKRGNCWEFPKRKLRWSNKSPVEFIISSYMHFPEKKTKNFCPPSENRHELVAFCGLFVYVDAAVIDSIVLARGRAEHDCSDAARYFFFIILFCFTLFYSSSSYVSPSVSGGSYQSFTLFSADSLSLRHTVRWTG